MKSIEDVFQTLKSAYPQESITLLQNEIIVLVDDFQIVGYSLENECVQLNKKAGGGKWIPITHCHPESYSELYEALVFYMDQREQLLERHQEESQYRRKAVQTGFLIFTGILMVALIISYI